MESVFWRFSGVFWRILAGGRYQDTREERVGKLAGLAEEYLQSEREIYQAPACIYNADGERSINRRHVYTTQTETDLSSAGMSHTTQTERDLSIAGMSHTTQTERDLSIAGMHIQSRQLTYFPGDIRGPSPREYLSQNSSFSREGSSFSAEESSFSCENYFSSCDSIAKNPERKKKVSTEMNAPPA